jgi:uncharacterized protein YbjT (DUF2867 family)
MSTVLVTGGTGVLGSRVVSRLASGGNAVRVLSRRERQGGDGVQSFRGELRSGKGLSAAVDGVDTIVHCASSPLWRARATEVSGLGNLIAATGAARPHLLYISIVGVDRIPYYYYRAKWEAEQALSASSLPWTILRATQFHYLISKYTIGRLAVAPKGARAQLLDASEVADRMVELVAAGPSGRVADMGGPEILTMRDVARLQKKVLGRRLWVLELPAVGRTARGFRDGFNLCPDQAAGQITYEEYLRSLRGRLSSEPQPQ